MSDVKLNNKPLNSDAGVLASSCLPSPFSTRDTNLMAGYDKAEKNNDARNQVFFKASTLLGSVGVKLGLRILDLHACQKKRTIGCVIKATIQELSIQEGQ